MLTLIWRGASFGRRQLAARWQRWLAALNARIDARPLPHHHRMGAWQRARLIEAQRRAAAATTIGNGTGLADESAGMPQRAPRRRPLPSTNKEPP